MQVLPLVLNQASSNFYNCCKIGNKALKIYVRNNCMRILASLDLWIVISIIAGSLESAYSLNQGVQKIWGQGAGEPLALL